MSEMAGPEGDVSAAVDHSEVMLSVCIPCYSASAAMVQQCLDSAVTQLPEDAEILVLPSGAHAISTVETLVLKPEVRVIPSTDSLDLVGNWNRCLNAASGSFIHILHEDDVVAPGFYDLILDMARRYPDAAMYATAAAQMTDRAVEPGELVAEPTFFDGLDAARFLLTDERHACGNVVLTRRAIEAKGGFLPQFAYCCDEEAYLRLAAVGGLGFHPARLYRERAHPGQSRNHDWLRPEFVPIYVGARLEGAKELGPDALDLAVRSTVQRVVSIAVTLASAGYRDESVLQLERLEQFIQPHHSRRITVAKRLCRSSIALAAIRIRRRLLARRLQ
jgi:hypothetical protein